MRLMGFNELIAYHVSYSRQEHGSLSRQASAFMRGRRNMRQSYYEEKVLIFFDYARSILIPDFLHGAESPVILADNFDVF